MRHLLCLCLFLLAFASALPLRADEPWEETVRKEEAEEDRLLEHAKRRGTTRQVVTKYASRLSRQPSPLNYYLLGRALYHDGNQEEAERQLREALRIEPRFWFARLRLAMLEVERKNMKQADVYLGEVLRQKPREADALKLLAQIRMDASDFDGALRVLDQLISLDPGNLAVRRNMAFCHMAKKDWPSALRELRVLRGRDADDPSVRWYYAQALYETGQFQETTRELEGLVRMDPRDARVLDMLRVVYARIEDWDGVTHTLRRLIPLVADPEMQGQLKDVLARLEAGERPGQGGTQAVDPEAWERDAFAELLERCMHPTDAQVRREALQIYHEAEPPMMPSALVRRIHPELEPDPVCRQWLLRIMAQLRNPELAQVAAFGLFDPESSVRAMAAETLGEIGTPSGLLYLLPFFLGPDLGEKPTVTEVQEHNAARSALIALTERFDHFGGGEAWVPASGLADLRRDWQVWLAQPAGVAIRLKAIEDMRKRGELRPELYLIEDVLDTNPSITRAAYDVLRARAARPSEDAVAQTMWPKFPVRESVTDEQLDELRAQVKAWWEAWLALRKAKGDGVSDGR